MCFEGKLLMAKVMINKKIFMMKTNRQSSLLQRIIWMIIIWIISVLLLGMVASIFKLLMIAAGMK